MKYEWIDEYLLKKPCVTKDLQVDWNWIRYQIGGKMFAAVCLDDEDKPFYITLKLEPLEGDFLRQQYEDIIPGYYMNKVHWNSIKAEGSVPDELVKELLDKSYDLVFRGFSKKKQKEILETELFFMTSDNNRIHYVDAGPRDGEGTILFVPGWGYSFKAFEKQIEFFRKTHRVIVMDPRGHGMSVRGQIEVGQVQQGKDLLELIEMLQLKEATLVGWSYGAYPVLEIVRETGLCHIGKVLIVDQPPKCAGTDKDGWVEYYPENIDRALIGLGTEEGYLEGVKNFTKRIAFIGEHSEEELDKVCKMADMDYSSALEEFVEGTKCDYTEEVKLLHANKKIEFVIREQWAKLGEEHLAKMCPGMKVHIMGGHMMFYEFPDEFNKILKKM